jgi:hypothetical protein
MKLPRLSYLIVSLLSVGTTSFASTQIDPLPPGGLKCVYSTSRMYDAGPVQVNESGYRITHEENDTYFIGSTIIIQKIAARKIKASYTVSSRPKTIVQVNEFSTPYQSRYELVVPNFFNADNKNLALMKIAKREDNGQWNLSLIPWRIDEMKPSVLISSVDYVCKEN